MRSEVEFEYLYIGREITIDKIMGKSTRKRVGTYDISSMEIFAPYISHRLDAYKSRKVEEKDYSIGVEFPEKLLNILPTFLLEFLLIRFLGVFYRQHALKV